MWRALLMPNRASHTYPNHGVRGRYTLSPPPTHNTGAGTHVSRGDREATQQMAPGPLDTPRPRTTPGGALTPGACLDTGGTQHRGHRHAAGAASSAARQATTTQDKATQHTLTGR